MKRGSESDAHRGLAEGQRTTNRPLPAPKNKLTADKVLCWLVVFVVAVAVLTPIIQAAAR